MNNQISGSFHGITLLGLTALLTFGFGSAISVFAAPVLPAAAAAADKEVKVKGTFEWANKKGEKHDLTGTLTPGEGGSYKVAWSFKWKDAPQAWDGTVTGNILNGKVSGTGVTGKRNFTFEGTAKDGTWTFQCFEDVKGSKKPQGNGELTVQK